MLKSTNTTLFTTLLCKNGQIIDLENHIERLSNDFLKIFKKKWPFELQELIDFLSKQSLKHNSYRLSIFATFPASFKLQPYQTNIKEYKNLFLYPEPFYEDLAQFKKKNFNKRHAMLALAKSQGYHDFLFTDQQNFLLETSIANIFWVHEKTLYTPSRQLSLYFGVTIQNIILAAQKLGFSCIETQEKDVSFLQSSYVFCCNSLKGICPIESINGNTCLKNNLLTEELSKFYLKETKNFPLPIP